MDCLREPIRAIEYMIKTQGREARGEEKEKYLLEHAKEECVRRVTRSLVACLDTDEDFTSKHTKYEIQDPTGRFFINFSVTPVHNVEDESNAAQPAVQISDNPAFRPSDASKFSEPARKVEEGDAASEGDESADSMTVQVSKRRIFNSIPRNAEQGERYPAADASPAGLNDSGIDMNDMTTVFEYLRPRCAPVTGNEFLDRQPVVTSPESTLMFVVKTMPNTKMASNKKIQEHFEARLRQRHQPPVIVERYSSKNTWIARFPTASAATAAKGSNIDFGGASIRLSTFYPSFTSTFICRKMPDDEDSLNASVMKLLDFFTESSLLMDWVQRDYLPAPRPGRNGHLVVRFQKPTDIERFQLNIPLENGEVFTATFNPAKYRDTGKCGLCAGKHSTSNCTCFRRVALREPHPRLLASL
jgi:hypothetical protein